MINQNKVQGEQINEILSQLLVKYEIASSPSSTISELNLTESVFDGELEDSKLANEWLTAVITVSYLNR